MWWAEHCVFERCVVYLVWNTVYFGEANTVYFKRGIVYSVYLRRRITVYLWGRRILCI